MYKYRNEMLPVFFNEIFTCNIDIHNYATRQRNKLHVPKCKLAVMQKYVAYQGVILWNNIYNTIDINCSIVTFKRKLRNYLLHNDV